MCIKSLNIVIDFDTNGLNSYMLNPYRKDSCVKRLLTEMFKCQNTNVYMYVYNSPSIIHVLWLRDQQDGYSAHNT